MYPFKNDQQVHIVCYVEGTMKSDKRRWSTLGTIAGKQKKKTNRGWNFGPYAQTEKK